MWFWVDYYSRAHIEDWYYGHSQSKALAEYVHERYRGPVGTVFPAGPHEDAVVVLD